MKAADRLRSRARAGRAELLAVCGLLVLLIGTCDVAAGSPPEPRRLRVERPAQAATARSRVTAHTARRAVLPSDDWTYRPTVLVRRGTSQGSGTIIASVDGETLVLTAAHVVKDDGPAMVELHRYNLGMERRPATAGPWPRVVGATVAASDGAADLAVLRIVKMTALPYVARLAPTGEKPAPASLVTSIGIDLGTRLTSWSSRLVDRISFELNDSQDVRPFLITEKIPEHGRSGGGLFQVNGELVGVCVGHAELDEGRRRGVFAAGESIHLLLEEHKMTATVVRSALRMARLKQKRSPSTQVSAPAFSSSPVTRARSRDEVQGIPPTHY